MFEWFLKVFCCEGIRLFLSNKAVKSYNSGHCKLLLKKFGVSYEIAR